MADQLPASIAEWDRYRVEERLGGGGVGVVYAAHDPRLQRRVAIKFLLQATPGSTACAARKTSIEERVLAMTRVCEALEAAHQLGLIHRDLKPDNILVERGDDGWRPLVTDFGLVRDLSSKGGTASGAIVGTPHFMAPEQARGDATDARTDVYGLGATLYTILAGAPPFVGNNLVEILHRVSVEEPRRLRSLASSLPVDLETITLKCLEKDPRRRYPSARTLADDLERFLAGDPIAARPISVVERMARRVRKHPATTVALLVAALALIGIGAATLVAQRRAVERARLAQEFGQRVESWEARLRYANLLPPHDTRAERAGFREELRRFEHELDGLGASAEGPGRYAAGRAHLALGDYATARASLERAAGAIDPPPAVATALGRALGELYRLEVERARGVPAKDGGRLLAEAKKRFRDPALEALRRSAGGNDHESLLVQSLIALHEDRFDEAVEKSRAALARASWFYEAQQLEGRIHLGAARDRIDHADFDGATREFALAEAAFRGAREVGRSDVELAADECSHATAQFSDTLLHVKRAEPPRGACDPIRGRSSRRRPRSCGARSRSIHKTATSGSGWPTSSACGRRG